MDILAAGVSPEQPDFVHTPDAPCEAVAVCGNGLVCAYSRGADVFDFIGPYYSSPSWCEMRLLTGCAVEGRQVRSTGIWEYRFLQGRRPAGGFTQFAPPGLPVFIRRFDCRETLAWGVFGKAAGSLRAAPETLIQGSGFDRAFLTEIPAGMFFYTCGTDDGKPAGYPVTDRLALIIAVRGEIACAAAGNNLSLDIARGDVYFIAGRSAADAWETLRRIGSTPAQALYDDCLSGWNDFTARRQHMAAPSGEKTRLADEIAEAADAAAALIKAQQDAGGGVIAGYNYHLAYVRDCYGVHRGLLALGCLEEDRRLLRYFAGVFGRYGEVRNAQGMGAYGFHRHENDAVEITAYLVLMAMEYFAASGDGETVNQALPLLLWCMEAQRNELRGGCLPFNGDETYIAGGLLGREHIIDGSMEATMLYHRAAQLLLKYLAENGGACSAFIKNQQAAKTEIERTFAANFIRGDSLMCNKPGIMTYRTAPAVRNGVRECSHGFGLCYKTRNLRYVCLDCLEHIDLPAARRETLLLPSTALMPRWVGSRLVPENVLSAMLTRFCGVSPAGTSGGKTVGYDNGLLLYALKGAGAKTGDAAQTVLSLRDETGAWAEYYEGGNPRGTRCRPWESAVNIAALLR